MSGVRKQKSRNQIDGGSREFLTAACAYTAADYGSYSSQECCKCRILKCCNTLTSLAFVKLIVPMSITHTVMEGRLA